MTDILCFGNLQLDILCRPVSALPTPGELQMVETIDFSLSGNGGNVAAVLGRLGLPVALAGYSGADMIGEQFRVQLQSLGIGLEKLERHTTAPTGTSIVTINETGERSILFVNGANALFDLNTVPDTWLQELRLLIVSSVFVLPQFTGTAVKNLFARAKAHGVTTILNICSDRNQQGLQFLAPALEMCDYFILSRDEGYQLTRQGSLPAMLSSLQGSTQARVILTLGAEGCCFSQEESFCSVPAQPVEAVDCTGAGDSFVAGFASGLLQGYSIEECARLGCRVAAFAVTGPGAYLRIPLLTELQPAHHLQTH